LKTAVQMRFRKAGTGQEKAEMSGENQELRKAGLKVTLPRVKIMQILESAESRHMSAEDVYKALRDADDDVGLATVYRVLTQFEAAGLVTRHHFEGGHSVFEMTPEDHHDHIVCTKCGRVEEFYDEVIEKQQRAQAAKFNFTISDHSLYIYGLCANCQKD
jgi:Fur family ferric uptake transcriptional regulator